MQVGIALVTVGLILSAWAPTALYLGLGRFIIGIASGLITTSAMLGLMNVVPDSHKLLAPQLSSIITAIGFGLGPFLGGVIAQFAEQPLVTPYLPVIVSAIFCGLGLFKLKQPAFEQQPFSVYPKLQTPDAPYQAAFFWSVSLRFVPLPALVCLLRCRRRLCRIFCPGMGHWSVV